MASSIRISHRLSTAASDTGMFAALRSVGLLGRARLAKRRIHARLRRLATKSCEKCGLSAEIIRNAQLQLFINQLRMVCDGSAGSLAFGYMNNPVKNFILFIR